MRKKVLALLAAIVVALSLTGCDALNSIFNGSESDSDSNSSITSDSTSGNTSSGGAQSGSPSDTSSDTTIKTEPQTVKCGDIVIQDSKRTFDVETTCGNAFVVMFHYISADNRRIENAIPSFRPLGVTSLKDILNDPLVGGGDLSESDFELIDGVYKMKDEEMAKTLLGSLAGTYSFDQYWKNLKMAELVSTEGISAEEAYPRVEEMFDNMNNNA